MDKMTRSQKSVLLVTVLTSFMGPFLISSVNVALPLIGKQLNLNAINLSWVMTGFLLSSGIFLLIAGRWADFIGHKKVFKWGTIIFFVFTVLCSFTFNGPWLIAMRFMQGVGASMLMATGPAILVREFPQNKRGAVLGITVAAVYIGLAVGPTAGGFISFYWGWQAIFYISACVVILVIGVAFLFLGKDHNKMDITKLDYWGALLYAIALASMVYGSSKINSTFGQLLTITGIIIMALFIWQQSRSKHAFFPTTVFKTNRLFAFSNLAALINYSATFAIVFLMSLYLQKALGLSTRETGAILVAQPIVMALFSPIAGRLSDRLEPGYLATAGMLICSIGLALFYFLNEHSSLLFIISNLAFIGLGFALFSSPNMNTIMSSVDKTQAGLASGISATMRVIGQILSMAIATALFAIFYDKLTIENIPVELFMKGIRISFLIFAIISTFGIYFSFNRGKLH